MKDLQYYIRLRAYSKRYGLEKLPISLVEQCYNLNLDLSDYKAIDDINFDKLFN